MTIDDVWYADTNDAHLLRIQCHWSNGGFPPDNYILRANLLNATGGGKLSNLTSWYVPLPKTKYTPEGVTPFVWEFKRPSQAFEQHGYFYLQIESEKYEQVRKDSGIIPAKLSDTVEFVLPNVATFRGMDCPDFFAPARMFGEGDGDPITPLASSYALASGVPTLWNVASLGRMARSQ